MLQRLAFRMVDADGDGFVRESDLAHWVHLALKYGTVPPQMQMEPRWSCAWLFGYRTLTAKELTRKWLLQADADKDGVLSAAEFEVLAPVLLHEVVRRLARTFAESRLKLR